MLLPLGMLWFPKEQAAAGGGVDVSPQAAYTKVESPEKVPFWHERVVATLLQRAGETTDWRE